LFLCFSCASESYLFHGSLFLLRGFKSSGLSLCVVLSFAGGLSLDVEVAKVVWGSWTTCASLHIFAWVVRRCGLSASALQAVLGRAALSVWLSKLEIRVGGEGDPSDAPNADEGMLYWLVLSMESAWTPREVLMWMFPCFWGILFDMIKDGADPL